MKATNDLYRAWLDSPDRPVGWYFERIEPEPLALICTGPDGRRWRLAVTVRDGQFVFGEPQEAPDD